MKLGNKSQAFTLVELMVAMVIGLIIIAGIFMVFLSSKQTYRLTSSMTQVHDNGRFAMNYLVKDVQKAGWVDNGIETIDGYSLAQPLVNLENNKSITGGQNSDVFTVRYYGDTDCDGDAATAGIVQNTYQLVATGDLPELQCNGVSLIKNVESFQVRYGILTAQGLEYVDANVISDITMVKTVQIGFTIASDESNVTSDKDISVNKVLNEGPYNFSDGRYRQVFSSTIILNNNGVQPPDSLLVSE
ncbi:MAG: PilW family protein [Kangiellaceae bacterium]|nr:PilW family protein [Kangiellaceae bacterium]